MSRKLYLVAALVFTGPSFSAFGLGLGDIHTKSGLNEKFNAQIELLSVPVGELDVLHVTLASKEAFERAGLDRSALLLALKYTPLRLENNKTVVRVTSDRIIREPFLNFLLEVHWPTGRLIKEYTVLLDPPIIFDRQPPKITQPEITQAKVVRRPPNQPSVRNAGLLTGSDETTSMGGQYGPVKSGETLSKIAASVRDKNVSIQQTMIALWKANPDAFIRNNINLLKKGRTLRVPGFDEVVKLNRKSARNEYQRQIDEWSAGAPVTAKSSDKAPVESSSTVEANVDTDDYKLRLITRRSTGDGSANSDENQTVSELQNQLILAKEEAERYRLESDSLKSRTSELIAQLKRMKQLISVNNEQSGQLQADIDTSLIEEAEISGSESSSAEVVGEEISLSASANESDAIEITSPEKELKGLLDVLVDNVILIAIAFVLGILTLIRFGRQKKAASDEVMEERFLYETVETEEQVDEVDEDKANIELSSADEAAIELSSVVEAIDNSLPDEPAANDLNVLADETGESELVSKADISIADGNYEQAEELFKQFLEKNPEKTLIRYKLMDVYYAMRNIEAFNEMVEFIVAAGEEDFDSDAWARAMEMSVELAGDSEPVAETEFHLTDSSDSVDPNWSFDDLDMPETGADDSEASIAEDEDFEVEVRKHNQG